MCVECAVNPYSEDCHETGQHRQHHIKRGKTISLSRRNRSATNIVPHPFCVESLFAKIKRHVTLFRGSWMMRGRTIKRRVPPNEGSLWKCIPVALPISRTTFFINSSWMYSNVGKQITWERARHKLQRDYIIEPTHTSTHLCTTK